MKVEFQLGVDVSAYATVVVDVDDISSDNLVAKAREILDQDSLDGDLVYEVDWDTSCAGRIYRVSSGNTCLLSDIPLRTCLHNGGMALQNFLAGKICLRELLDKASHELLIDESAPEFKTAVFTTPGGEEIECEYSVRHGATQAECDLAVMAALMQKCTLSDQPPC